jgi:hypothetical protein
MPEPALAERDGVVRRPIDELSADLARPRSAGRPRGSRPSRVDVVGLGLPFAGGHRDRRHSTPAGELRCAGEPVWVSDLDEKVRRRHDTDTVQVGERGSELGE